MHKPLESIIDADFGNTEEPKIHEQLITVSVIQRFRQTCVAYSLGLTNHILRPYTYMGPKIILVMKWGKVRMAARYILVLSFLLNHLSITLSIR